MRLLLTAVDNSTYSAQRYILRTRWAHPGLTKVDAANKLPDNHDVHAIHNLALQGRSICQM